MVNKAGYFNSGRGGGALGGWPLRFPWKKKTQPQTPPEELRQFDLRTGSSPGSSVESVGPPHITIIFFVLFVPSTEKNGRSSSRFLV